MSTWTAASSCDRGLAQPGLLGGRLPDASPPAAVNRLRCPAGKLLSPRPGSLDAYNARQTAVGGFRTTATPANACGRMPDVSLA